MVRPRFFLPTVIVPTMLLLILVSGNDELLPVMDAKESSYTKESSSWLDIRRLIGFIPLVTVFSDYL